MQYIRTRGLTERCEPEKYFSPNGKYSIWDIILSPNEKKKFALEHPDKKTYHDSEKFMVTTKVSHGGISKIRLLDYEDESKIVKELSFMVEIEENVADTFENHVTFTPIGVKKEDIVIINKDLSITPFKYRFNEEQLGFRTGSFYNLFADLVKYGYFCEFDGSKIVEDHKHSEEVMRKKNAERDEKRKQIEKERKDEYARKLEEKKQQRDLARAEKESKPPVIKTAAEVIPPAEKLEEESGVVSSPEKPKTSKKKK